MKSCGLLFLVPLFIVISPWSFIQCVDDFRSRDVKFRKKYFERQYTPWSKMLEADNTTLVNVCLKFSSLENENNDEATVELHWRTNCTLMYGQGDEVTLDIIQCKIQRRSARKQTTENAMYYLADGYDEGSAFKIFLHPPSALKQRIALGGELPNIWNRTVHLAAKNETAV